jgi:hypothetical protein
MNAKGTESLNTGTAWAIDPADVPMQDMPEKHLEPQLRSGPHSRRSTRSSAYKKSLSPLSKHETVVFEDERGFTLRPRWSEDGQRKENG